MPLTPDVREWALLFYLVAEAPPGVDAEDPAGLAHAAERELDALASGVTGQAAGPVVDRFRNGVASKDVHVAYQVDFGSVKGFPPGRRQQMGEAPDPSYLGRAAGPGASARERDLRAFLAWARRHCPSRRVLLMFWGHSYGPAGLFDLDDRGLAKPVPRPPAPSVATAFQVTTEMGLSATAAALFTFPNDAVLVFKDCWMSTLEVACELAPFAGFVLASQAAVPVPVVWDYRTMAARAAAGVDAEAMADACFSSVSKTYAGMTHQVPYSLLDLRHTPAVMQAVKALIRASRDGRVLRAACDRCVTGPYVPASAGGGAPGAIALVDVRRLTDALKETSLAPQAHDLRVAVDMLVRKTAQGGPTCTGVSVFKMPSPAVQKKYPDDEMIWGGLDLSPDDYQVLRFHRGTRVSDDVSYYALVAFHD